ncbi:IS1182 family transposase [Arthrobacter livingstonensis]|uniref:IS1182 family transposase n=1 Tax=Arthrobacter livingstonensis TaxID=670078 RepID=A0A2V5L5A4_9MICC|nr:IS1182 family transposase [Arthrobacter livingstonensis]PYI66535.1 IS1182 family transposase [Arthrobacter livingstonensis]
MTLGLAPTQGDLLRSTVNYCHGRVPEDFIYAVLHRECFNLFPDAMFADLFTDVGRRSVPPMIVAVVMVLQRIEGCSDREAVDRFAFDARWKYAAGGLDFDYPGFVHTVLVDMRARLASSEAPDRIFQVTLEAARAAGLVGRKRVLDSTPLYDAVATMDTVTLLRSGIRGLLKVADADLESLLRAVLDRDDDYATAGKPVCAWDDAAARKQVVDALAKDGHAALAVLEGMELGKAVAQAGELLATLLGQDLDCVDGVFHIARRVAKDRVISTVDPEARHGHKTSARGFDGYKGHVAIDPDSEIITATAATAGNTGDAAPAAGLLANELNTPTSPEPAEESTGEVVEAGGAQAHESLAVYGDAANGAGALLVELEAAGATVMVKVQPPVAPGGRYPKDRFIIDTKAGTVSCPAKVSVPIRPVKAGGGRAAFGAICAACPLASQCTTSKAGRTISISAYEDELVRARQTQQDPAWREEYRATRPKVERKLGHMMRRKHGGRRARVRGLAKVKADFSLLAAAVNIARLGVLKISQIVPSAPAAVPA